MKVDETLYAGAARILDVGGWFKPNPRATHVVDLMPWETRGARLTLAPLPHERFTRATWHQADFLQPDFRLPYADRSFDLVLCGHTLEDLTDPEPLLREMQRVGLRGCIECPSRLTEQTKGVRDRRSRRPGHPHHHWIVDADEQGLRLYAKQDSGLDADRRLLPLAYVEPRIKSGAFSRDVTHVWTESISYRIVRGKECRRRAEEFVATMCVPPAVRLHDRILRLSRRLRASVQGRSPDEAAMWREIVELSRPYSSVELK